jgi:hypothetical protein
VRKIGKISSVSDQSFYFAMKQKGVARALLFMFFLHHVHSTCDVLYVSSIGSATSDCTNDNPCTLTQALLRFNTNGRYSKFPTSKWSHYYRAIVCTLLFGVDVFQLIPHLSLLSFDFFFPIGVPYGREIDSVLGNRFGSRVELIR